MRKIKEYPLNGKLREAELQKMPKADLLILLTIITDANRKIKKQINCAHAKKRSSKEPIDHTWLNRAKKSRENKKRHLKMVEAELNIRKMNTAKKNRHRNSAA